MSNPVTIAVPCPGCGCGPDEYLRAFSCQTGLPTGRWVRRSGIPSLPAVFSTGTACYLLNAASEVSASPTGTLYDSITPVAVTCSVAQCCFGITTPSAAIVTLAGVNDQPNCAACRVGNDQFGRFTGINGTYLGTIVGILGGVSLSGAAIWRVGFQMPGAFVQTCASDGSAIGSGGSTSFSMNTVPVPARAAINVAGACRPFQALQDDTWQGTVDGCGRLKTLYAPNSPTSSGNGGSVLINYIYGPMD